MQKRPKNSAFFWQETQSLNVDEINILRYKKIFKKVIKDRSNK